MLGRHCSVSIQCLAEGQRRWGRERQVARVEIEGQHWRTSLAAALDLTQAAVGMTSLCPACR